MIRYLFFLTIFILSTASQADSLKSAQMFSPTNIVIHTTGSLTGVLSGDIDRDGRTDLMTFNEAGEVYLYKNDYPSSPVLFQDPEFIATDVLFNPLTQLVDLNGDGYLDLVSPSGYGTPYFTCFIAPCHDADDYTLLWWKNFGHLHGQTTFQDAQVIANDLPGILSVQFIDIDGDGDLDLFCGALFRAYYIFSFDVPVRIERYSSVFVNNAGEGDPSFNELIRIFSGVLGRVGDLNNDDILDAIYTTGPYLTTDYMHVPDRLMWDNDILKNDASTYWETLSDTLITESGLFGVPYHLIDLDKDGYTDILSNSFYILNEFPSGGSFSSPREVRPSGSPVDLNGDGFVDLLSLSESGGLSWQENLRQKPSLFLGSQSIRTSRVVDYAPIDFDRDGDMDLAVFLSNPDELVLIENLSREPFVVESTGWMAN